MGKNYDKLVEMMLKDNFTIEDLDALANAYDKAATAKKESEAVAAARMKEKETAYASLLSAWVKYLAIEYGEEGVAAKRAKTVLDAAIVAAARDEKRNKASAVGLKETYDAAKGKREVKQLTEEEIDEALAAALKWLKKWDLF